MEDKSEARKRKKLREAGSPAWAITWRVLLVCVAIDLPLWAYFNFVKGVSFWDGIMQMRSAVQAKINPPKVDQPIPIKIVDNNQAALIKKPS